MKRKPTMGDEVMSSWVLHALREVLGYQDIRNMILRQYIKDKHVDFGRTFGAEHTKKQLQTYLEELIKKGDDEKYVLFTASNEAYRNETHYQTFIVDYGKKKLWAIDPASEMGQEGIYSSYAANEIIIPYFAGEGWKTGFVELTNACQSTVNDVFCQTWSLWLQIKFMRVLTDKTRKIGPLRIAKSLDRRYIQLLKFYKQIITDIPEVCNELKETFRHEIKTNKALIKGLNVKKAKEVREYYINVDACEKVQKMNEFDLMTEEERILNL